MYIKKEFYVIQFFTTTFYSLLITHVLVAQKKRITLQFANDKNDNATLE